MLSSGFSSIHIRLIAWSTNCLQRCSFHLHDPTTIVLLLLLPGFKSTKNGAQVLQLSLTDDKLTQYGAGFNDLSVEVTPESETRLHVKIQPTGQKRWEVPESIVPR